MKIGYFFLKGADNAEVVLRIVSVVASGLVLGMLGMLIAAWFGGNYAERFQFAGVRGYEATGLVGFIIGTAIGIFLSEYFLEKKKEY